MGENISVVSARYQQVALDIAAKIVDKQYQIGEKIYARSLIASQYAVSSETARRAIAILSDVAIVDTVKGSGVVIKSYDNAVAFLKRYRDIGTMAEFKQDAVRRLDNLVRESAELRESISRLVDHTDRFRAMNPLAPSFAVVEPGAICAGKSLNELHFWQNTAATVIAIRRGAKLTLSPGPYADLQIGDTLYFVGEEDCLGRVALLLQNGT